MTDDDSLLAAIHEPIALVPHDDAWPARFERERSRLLSLFPAAFVAVEHIGSTAIPGLSAKPVIDLLAGVASFDDVDALGERLCALGYTTSAEFNASLADRKWFMRWADGRRTHHLHVVVHGGLAWRQRLVFRDRLRRDRHVAERYARLKAALAEAHPDDREAYTDGKAQFVAALSQGEPP